MVRAYCRSAHRTMKTPDSSIRLEKARIYAQKKTKERKLAAMENYYNRIAAKARRITDRVAQAKSLAADVSAVSKQRMSAAETAAAAAPPEYVDSRGEDVFGIEYDFDDAFDSDSEDDAFDSDSEDDAFDSDSEYDSDSAEGASDFDSEASPSNARIAALDAASPVAPRTARKQRD